MGFGYFEWRGRITSSGSGGVGGLCNDTGQRRSQDTGLPAQRTYARCKPSHVRRQALIMILTMGEELERCSFGGITRNQSLRYFHYHTETRRDRLMDTMKIKLNLISYSKDTSHFAYIFFFPRNVITFDVQSTAIRTLAFSTRFS